jgi:hypothetical protein
MSLHTVCCEMPVEIGLMSDLCLQILHENVRTPLCIVWCVFRLERWANFFLQILHEKGRFLVCTLRWMLRLERWLNFFLHNSHSYGRPPLCILVWSFTLERRVKLFFHTWHGKRRSRSIVGATELHFSVNDGAPVSQRDIISLPLVLKWLDRLFLRENCFLHISQESKLTSLCLPDNSEHSSPNSRLL